MNRFQHIKKVSILGILANLFLLLIKGSVGFITNSKAMIADFFNSAGDIFSSLMTFIGSIISNKPMDDDHNLGHGKAEYIYSLLISIAMIVTALIMGKESVVSIFTNNQVIFSMWFVVVCIITIAIKFTLFLYTNYLAKKLNSLLLKANASDHRNDCIMTTGTLFSAIMSYYHIYFFDGLIGFLISLWILVTAYNIFKESYDVLMDKSIDEKTKLRVYEIIEKHPEVVKVQHFNATPIGYLYQVSFSIFVDGNLSTFESHEIANFLEKEITSKIDEIYLVVIHVNPIELDTV